MWQERVSWEHGLRGKWMPNNNLIYRMIIRCWPAARAQQCLLATTALSSGNPFCWEKQAKTWARETFCWEEQAKTWARETFCWEEQAKTWARETFCWEEQAKTWARDTFSWEEQAKTWARDGCTQQHLAITNQNEDFQSCSAKYNCRTLIGIVYK